MDKSLIVYFDASNAMGQGTDPRRPWQPEPWTSAIAMIRSIMEKLPVGFVSPLGPQLVSASFPPPAKADEVLGWLQKERGWSSGWMRWQIGLEAAVMMALDHWPAEVLVVARGPVMDWDRAARLDMAIEWARNSELPVHVAPMGNQPDWLFPNVEDLRRLARGTGGNVYWRKEQGDFDYLPELADEIIADFEGAE